MNERKKNAPPAFEEAMQKLEAVVAALEDEKLPLDDMLARYEEGVALARLCTEKLEAAEQKVHLISRKAGGEIVLENFGDAADE